MTLPIPKLKLQLLNILAQKQTSHETRNVKLTKITPNTLMLIISFYLALVCHSAFCFSVFALLHSWPLLRFSIY